MILGLCDRFHCLPSQILEEDAEVLRLVQIENLIKPKEKPTQDDFREVS